MVDDSLVAILRDKTDMGRLAQAEVRRAVERLEEEGYEIVKKAAPAPATPVAPNPADAPKAAAPVAPAPAPAPAVPVAAATK